MNKPYSYPVDLQGAYPASGAAEGAQFPALKLQQVVRTIRRRFWTLLAVALSIFAFVAYSTFTTTPIYRSTSTIIVDQRANDPVDLGAVVTGLANEPGGLETELEVIMSPVLLERVVRKLELHKLPEFNSRLAAPSQSDRIKDSIRSGLGSIIPGLGSNNEEQGPPLTATEREDADISAATAKLRRRVNATRVGRTLLFDITVGSEDSDRAAEISNAVADQYLVDQLDAKFDQTRRANAWLDERLSGLREEVNAAESAVERYRSEKGLLSAQGQTLTEANIADISGQVVEQEAEYQGRLARLTSVREQIARGSSESISEAVNSATVRNLRAELATVIRQRSDLETRYGPRHPEVVRVVREEQDLQSQIDQEIQRIVASLESEVAIARKRLESLRGNLSNLRDELSENNQELIRLRELERNRDAVRTLYEAFLSRFKQTNEQESFTEADARILSYAEASRAPALPTTRLNLVLGLLMGCAAAGALALMLELMDNRVSSGDEVEEKFGVPFLGNVPLLSGIAGARQSPPKYLVKHPMSAYAESMRNLRASVKFANIDKPARLVTVTSSFPNEGKTSLTLSLGRMSAMTGSRTLVIDGDFRRRQLTEVAGIEPKVGLIEHLLGSADITEAIHKDAETELDILPLTRSGNTTRDVFGSKAFDSLILRLKAEYDMIVIDTAPILLMAETRVIAAKSDQVVVVARWRKTNRGSLQQTLSILREFNSSVAGVVLTFVDLKRLNRHSGAALSNYRAYSKYYINN